MIDAKEFEPCPETYIHLFIKSSGTGDIWVFQPCSRSWCPRCVGHRSWKIATQLRIHLNFHRARSMFFITASVRNSFTMNSAWNEFQWTWKRFLDFSRSPKSQWSKIGNWIGVREITDSVATGINLHQHLIVSTSSTRLNYQDLKKSWSKSAGYRAHFDISKVRIHHEKAVNYLSKYLSKRKMKIYWGGLSQIQCYRYRSYLKGKNRISRSRGSLPPKNPSSYQMCCDTSHRGECNRA